MTGASIPSRGMLEQPLTLATVGALGSLVLGGMGLAWVGSAQITEIRGDLRAVATRLENSVEAGRREREALKAQVEAVDRQQAAEIASLRVQSEALALQAARTEAKLDALKAGQDHMLAIIERQARR